MNFSKLPKEKKEHLIMVGLGTGMILAVLNYFLIGGYQDKLAEVARGTADRKDKVYKAEQIVKMMDRINQNLEASKQRLEVEENKMPSADQYRWLVETVPPFMQSREVHFEECTPKPIVDAPSLLPKMTDYKSATFGVKASAKYHDFGKFLADFENNFPYITIQNLKVRPRSSKMAAVAPGPAGRRLPTQPEPDFAGPTEILNFEMQFVCLFRP